MSENNSYVVKFELPQIVNTALTPLAKSIGKTLSHGWEGMTMGIETWYGRKEIDKDLNLKLYQDALNYQLSIIDEDNLQEPSMNILGPSLEASKYYFEEKQYREMFAKLIASSCDKSKNPYIHPAFVEFIKQMTSLEGKIISSIDIDDPLALNVIQVSDNSRKYYATCPVIPNLYNASLIELNAALVNLERLGLLKIPTGIFVTMDGDDKLMNSCKVSKIKEQVNSMLPFNCEYLLIHLDLTMLGKNFIKVCV